jgi:hypothetical protein
MTELKENATAKAARLRAEATARRADTTTPIDTLGKAPLASVPEPPAAEDAPEMPRIEIRTTVEHRGRSFVIVANGYTLDQFCDILDKRAYTPAQQTQEWQRLPDGTPICAAGRRCTVARWRSTRPLGTARADGAGIKSCAAPSRFVRY